MKKELEKKEKELQLLVQKYNQTQQSLNQIGQEILKIQGSIETLNELLKTKEV